jgi:hypothetical protein
MQLPAEDELVLRRGRSARQLSAIEATSVSRAKPARIRITNAGDEFSILQELRFAADSLLEGTGFEIVVPDLRGTFLCRSGVANWPGSRSRF